MTDTITQLGESLVQHGKHNDRIYLMKVARDDMPDLVEQLDQLAERRDYSKIFAKVPRELREPFLDAGYEVEAEIEGFYRGERAGVFLGKYRDPQRARDEQAEDIERILELARDKAAPYGDAPLPEGLRMRACGPDDCAQMAELYKRVFETYPFPIHDPKYLRETMATHIRYFGVWRDDELVALSSAETDRGGSNVEMTDFATDPSARGQGLASCLLVRMERAMRREGFRTAYTIARAVSAGMNIVFARAGYQFCGTLTNNTNISGQFESMNVWCKALIEL